MDNIRQQREWACPVFSRQTAASAVWRIVEDSSMSVTGQRDIEERADTCHRGAGICRPPWG